MCEGPARVPSFSGPSRPGADYTGKVAPEPLHPLLVVIGPTASGKSHLALALARRFQGEIVNCDSLQIYCGMDIGTAKTPPAERGGVPHHLFDFLAPGETYNAGQFAADARRAITGITGRGRLAVLAGGTGFYLRALLQGLADGPVRDEALRERLSERETGRPGSLHRLLRRLDALTAARIHPNDRHKTIRALEICLLARRPASQVFAQGSRPLEGYRVLQLGLDPPRPLLHQRIAARTEAMFAQGLLEEVRSLLQQGVPPTAKAFESIGYKEALACLRGELTRAAALELTTIATRQYAKRQMTWFRRDPGVRWLAGFGDDPRTLALAEEIAGCWLAEFTTVTQTTPPPAPYYIP